MTGDPLRLVVRGGPIYTADWERPWTQAVAIGADGRVVAVGREAEGAAGRAEQVIELGGRLATPGFHDAHTHLQWGGLEALRLDLTGCASLEQALEAIREAAGRCPEGEWICGRGWDESRWPERRPPTLEELDGVAAGRPIFLKRVDGHSALVNREALRRAGIEAGRPDPPGGLIERDRSGRPTGVLRERAMALVGDLVPPPGRDLREAGVRIGIEEALRHGLTSVQDHLGEAELYRSLRERGEPVVRVSLWQDWLLEPDCLAELRAAGRPYDRWVRFGLLKGFLDGSLGSHTAALEEAYADRPGWSGMLLLPPREVIERVVLLDRAGYQIGLHAIGDAACRTALDAYQEAARRNGTRGRRHRVEHAQIVGDRDFVRFADLEVIASVQPVHLASDHAMVEPRLGPRRVRRAYAWRSLLQAGAVVAFGSDYPVEPFDVLAGLQAAVTRCDRGGTRPPLVPEEALSLREAIDAYTIWAAYAEGTEEWKGRLRPGWVGDLTIFSDDLFRLPPHRLTEARVEATIVDGRVAYRADAG